MHADPLWVTLFRQEAIQLREYSSEMILRQREARTFMREAQMKADPFNDPEAFKQECHDLNTRFFEGHDYVRFERTARMSKWPPEIADATMGFATYLQMIYGENPLGGRDRFDYLIAFAGARFSTLDRLCHIVLRLADTKVFLRPNTGKIIVAGSTRVLPDTEKPYVQDFAPGAETEFDLCLGAREYVMNLYPGQEIETVCTDIPRANTGNVIDAVMVHVGGGKGLRIGGVTTELYHAQLDLWMAMAKLRHDWVGFQAAGHCANPRLVAERKDEAYWNECLSTLRVACMAYHTGC